MEKNFLISPKLEQKKATDYIKEEMLQDLNFFPEELHPLVKKYALNLPLRPEEASQVLRAQRDWWQEKYGFSYHRKAERQSVLDLKYAPTKELEAQKSLQRKLFSALLGRDQDYLEKIKKEYLERYPDQLEGITAIFELPDFFQLDRRAKASRKKKEKVDEKVIEELTQYQYLLTHFLKINSSDKEFLQVFWEAAEKLAGEEGELRRLYSLRRAVLSQVATMKTLEALGLKPELSTPKEDAFYKIDLWLEKQNAVQVKGAERGRPRIYESEELIFPAVRVRKGRRSNYYNAFLAHEFQNFVSRVAEYQKLTREELKCYLVVIPYSKFDPVTGEPKPEIIDFFKEKIAR